MSAFSATRDSVVRSAESLTALLRGEEGIEAEVGALVLADGIDCLRAMRKAFTKRGRR